MMKRHLTKMLPFRDAPWYHWKQTPSVGHFTEAETGVELADKLSHAFKTRNNGTDMTEQRRNKYLMQETVTRQDFEV